MFCVPSVVASSLRQSSFLTAWKHSHQLPVLSQISRNFSPKTSCTRLSPADVREVQIPVPWGHISGKWWGDVNIQPVVGIHGRQDNANSFDRLAPLLNVPSFLALDMVGHGRSSHYPVGQCYHFIDDVANLRRVARHFAWDKLTLLGHSIGSTIALSYAAYFPDSVDVLISLDCVRGAIRLDRSRLVSDIRAALESNLQVEERLGRPPPTYKLDDIVDLYMQASHGSLTRDSCKVILERGLVKTEEGRYYLSRDPRMKFFVVGAYDEDYLHALVAQVTCAVLSVRALHGFAVGGTRERVYLDTLCAMEKSARRFKHEDVDGTHHVHLNDPAVVADIINEFLRDSAQTPTTIY